MYVFHDFYMISCKTGSLCSPAGSGWLQLPFHLPVCNFRMNRRRAYLSTSERRTSSPFLGRHRQNVFQAACYNPHGRAGILTTSWLQSCRLVPGLTNRWKRVDPACLDPADPHPAIQAAPHPPTIHLTHWSSEMRCQLHRCCRNHWWDQNVTGSKRPNIKFSVLIYSPFPALYPLFCSHKDNPPYLSSYLTVSETKPLHQPASLEHSHYRSLTEAAIFPPEHVISPLWRPAGTNYLMLGASLPNQSITL